VRFRIQPIPRRRSRGAAAPSRAISGRMLAPLSIQPQEPIRNAVLAKTGRYGERDAPYIVAVNAMSDYADADSAVDALFGSPAVMVRSTPDGFEDRRGRSPDGAWIGPAGPVNRRVSAVFSTERLTPWNLGQRRARLTRIEREDASPVINHQVRGMAAMQHEPTPGQLGEAECAHKV